MSPLEDYELAMNWFFRRRLTPEKLKVTLADQMLAFLHAMQLFFHHVTDPADKDVLRFAGAVSVGFLYH